MRRDVSAATLSDYQRGASAALWRDTVLLSMAHGELMNTAFQEALYAAVGTTPTTRTSGRSSTPSSGPAQVGPSAVAERYAPRPAVTSRSTS